MTDSLTPSVQEVVDLHSEILDATTDGWWCLDLDDYKLKGLDCCEYLSPGYWLSMGRSPVGMPHKPSSWLGLIDAEDGKAAMDLFVDHLHHGKPYKIRVKYKHKSGGYVHILCRGTATGSVMIGCHHIVTDLIMTSERVVELGRDIKAALENMGG